MSSPNPYAAPKAPVADEAIALPGHFTPGGRARPAGEGWTWIVDGWRFFLRSPGTWIAIALVMIVIFFVLALIPLVGGLALSLLTPVFVGGLMLGCRALDEGGEIEFRHLFAGFQNSVGNLIAVGALYLGLSIAVILIVMAFTGASMFTLFSGSGAHPPPGAAGTLPALALLAVLIGLALFVPIAMAMWFAAPLVVLNQLGPVEAMKQSFSGCLRNVVPFLVYGVVTLVLAIVASVPIGLGWLVLMPIGAGSLYASYRAIYLS